MLKLASFHIQAHLNAFLQILECFSQICLGPLARELLCINIYTGSYTDRVVHRKEFLAVITKCLIFCFMKSLKKICPASFRETCQWLKFPLNGLRAQSRVSTAVGLLPLASGPACLGMAFPPFLVKQLYRCDSVVISSFVRTGYIPREGEDDCWVG